MTGGARASRAEPGPDFENFKRDLRADKRNPIARLSESSAPLDRLLRKMVSVSELFETFESGEPQRVARARTGTGRPRLLPPPAPGARP